MEKIDVFDKNMNFIREGLRGEQLRPEEYYLFIHVWVIRDNKILIQKRSNTRPWAPNLWATTSGVVSAGESIEDAVLRELREEMNLVYNIEDIEFGFKFSWESPNSSAHGYVYLIFDNTKQEVKIDYDEVVDFKYVSMEEIYSLIDNDEFVYYDKFNSDKYDYFDKVVDTINQKRRN